MSTEANYYMRRHQAQLLAPTMLMTWIIVVWTRWHFHNAQWENIKAMWEVLISRALSRSNLTIWLIKVRRRATNTDKAYVSCVHKINLSQIFWWVEFYFNCFICWFSLRIPKYIFCVSILINKNRYRCALLELILRTLPGFCLSRLSRLH